jgi:hypothetical protein
LSGIWRACRGRVPDSGGGGRAARSWTRRRIKHRALRKQLDTALVTAAGRQGIRAEQLVERSVPNHGLARDGSLEQEWGGYRVRVAIEDTVTVRLTFTGPGGRPSRTAPAAVKDGFPDELKQLKALAKEVRGTLSGERARVEALMSTNLPRRTTETTRPTMPRRTRSGSSDVRADACGRFRWPRWSHWCSARRCGTSICSWV